MNFCKNFGLKEMAVALGFLNLIPSAQGMRFRPITMNNLIEWDKTAVVNVNQKTNPAYYNPNILTLIGEPNQDNTDVFQEVAQALTDVLNIEKARDFDFTMAERSIDDLANKHIVGKIDGTVGTEWNRPTCPGGFLAVTGNWSNRKRLAHSLIDAICRDPNKNIKRTTKRVLVSYGQKRGWRRQTTLEITFGNNANNLYALFYFKNTNGTNMEIENSYTISGIRIIYDTEDKTVITCYPF